MCWSCWTKRAPRHSVSRTWRRIGLFANLAAVAIEQSRNHSRLGALVAELIRAVDGAPDYERQA